MMGSTLTGLALFPLVVLLPVSLVGGLILVWQGVPMNWNAYTIVQTLDGGRQLIAQGPVAALEFIESLGTNGGGFFNVNNAHPYQDPTPLANVVEMLAIVVVPAALTYTFGRMIGRTRQGWVRFGVMAALFVLGLVACGWAEQSGNPMVAAQAHIAVAQRRRPATPGTLPTDSTLFAVVIVGTALLVGALTFLPAVSLGPLVEHLLMVGH